MTDMIKSQRSREDAVTGLELVIVILVIIIAVGIILCFHGGDGKANPSGPYTGGRQGLLTSSVRTTGDLLHPVGTVIGYSAVDTVQNGLAIRFKKQDQTKLGAVEMTVSLFMGNMGGIDMDKTTVGWVTGGQNEIIKKTSPSTLICPNWTISQKLNMLPGKSANADDILDPNEQFVLFICPSAGLAPNAQAILTIAPAGDAFPLPVQITAPSFVQPIQALH